MPDGRERTAAEREAVRLDREHRRTGLDGGDLGRVAPASRPPGPDPGDIDGGSREPGLDGHGQLPTGEHELGTGEHKLGTDEHELGTAEHELELPSGTRRVSHGETIAARRERAPRKVRRRVAPSRERRRPGEPGRTGHSWVGRIVSVLLLAVAGALIWFLVELFQPFQGAPHGRITVRIPQHAGSRQIGNLLASDGVISSGFFFELRATLAGERGDLRPGVYHLQLGMSYGAVLTALTKPPPAVKITQATIIEGRNRQEISALLRSQHVRGSYLAATRHSPLLNPRSYGVRHRPASLEGFLFPDTYDLVEPIKISSLVADQLRAFKQNFAKVNLSYARRRHLTPYDVVTIASLIEAEASTPRSRPLVASVIYNRLADGMMLQLDSTTRFATGNFTRPITVSELHSSSPYNTHTHLGLPPGPIDSPGLAALQAAAHPARSHYLFFFARSCGRGTVFATTYSEFLTLGSRYLNQRCH